MTLSDDRDIWLPYLVRQLGPWPIMDLLLEFTRTEPKEVFWVGDLSVLLFPVSIKDVVGV